MYEPAEAVVVLLITGLGVVDVKLPGPVQLYTTPVVLLKEVSFKVSPAHSGPLPVATGLAGVGFMATAIVFVAEHPFSVAVTE